MHRPTTVLISAVVFSFSFLLSAGCGQGDKGNKDSQPKLDSGLVKGPHKKPNLDTGPAKDADKKGKPDADPKKKPGKGDVRKPDFSVNVQEFTKEFIADRDAADRKYDNKDVLLTGQVEEMGKNKFGDLLVARLKGGNGRQVSVTLGNDAVLKKGDTVRFRVELVVGPPRVTAKEIEMGVGHVIGAK